jgi:peptidyl-prolyl cis-trans isomerase C
MLLALLSGACSRGAPSGASPTTDLTTQVTSPEPSITIAPPTRTPAPLAARVNGWEITLAEYQAELALYQAATGTNLATEDKQRVLDDLIDQALLAQAAQEKGYIVDAAMLKERMEQMANQLSGQQAMTDGLTLPAWINAHGFTDETFQQALRRSMASAWMRDQIIASVEKTAEQVHARQILLYNAEDANAALASLQAGSDFGELAFKYDPVTGGDLGWFPRGYLTDPKVEEAAFILQPSQYSPVLESPAGFHILQVVERETQRPLDPQVLLTLQALALKEWVEQQRSSSDIQVLTP